MVTLQSVQDRTGLTHLLTF